MSNAKTQKSYTKRLKIRKSGKLQARKPGLNHFNAKQPRYKQLNKKQLQEFSLSNKNASTFLPHSK